MSYSSEEENHLTKLFGILFNVSKQDSFLLFKDILN